MRERQRQPRTKSGGLSLRDIEVLDSLSYYDEVGTQMRGVWARPMDVGGSNGSHHSYTLNKLVRLGYAKAQQRGALGMSRGSKEYRITEAGLDFVRTIRDRRFGQPHFGHEQVEQ